MEVHIILHIFYMFNILNTFYMYIFCILWIYHQKNKCLHFGGGPDLFQKQQAMDKFLFNFQIHVLNLISAKIQRYLSYFVCEGNFRRMAEVCMSAECFPNSLHFDTDPATILQE